VAERRRRGWGWLWLAALVGNLPPAPALAQALVPDGEIALPDTRGRIDHMAIDLSRRRLIVAELGNDTVDIVDLVGRKRLTRITGLAEPQGVGFAAVADRYVVANARDGAVRLYRGDDLSAAGSVELGDDADNVRVDAAGKLVLVGYGRGGIAAIDPAAPAKLGDIPLPAHPEGFQIDPAGRRLYVNLTGAHQIAVVDRVAGRVDATWNTGALTGNFPLALDDMGALVATVFREPPMLVVYGAQHGEVRARLPTCGDADDVFFDNRRGRIYVSCGAGMIDVFGGGPAYRHAEWIATASGARTSLFVPALDRLYVAVRAGSAGAAAIRVFRPAP